ncbi:hypothetical protein CMI42_04140, partial [Candidatus Pacearchaeota archaeon]|nr:hypothetical protein [Candidatus Pacearchaeota archaeon]
RMKDSQELLGRKINDYSKVFSVDDYNKIVESVGGNEFLESVVKTKTDGFIDLDGFKRLTDESEIKKVIDETNIFSSQTLVEALDKVGTRELQDLILEKAQLRKSSPNPADDLLRAIELIEEKELEERGPFPAELPEVDILKDIYQKEVVESPYNLKEFIRTHSDEEVLMLAEAIENERLSYIYDNEKFKKLDLSPSDNLLLGLSAYRETEDLNNHKNYGSKKFREDFERRLDELTKARKEIGSRKIYDKDFRFINMGSSSGDVDELNDLSEYLGVSKEKVINPSNSQEVFDKLSKTKRGPLIISFNGETMEEVLALTRSEEGILTPELFANSLIWSNINADQGGGKIINLNDVVIMINSNSDNAYLESFPSTFYETLDQYNGKIIDKEEFPDIPTYKFPRLEGKPIIVTTQISDGSENPMIKSLKSGPKGPVTVDDFLRNLGDNMGSVDGSISFYDDSDVYRELRIRSSRDILEGDGLDG